MRAILVLLCAACAPGADVDAWVPRDFPDAPPVTLPPDGAPEIDASVRQWSPLTVRDMSFRGTDLYVVVDDDVARIAESSSQFHFVLAEDVAARWLAVDDTHVYYTTVGNTVGRVPRAGGTPETILDGTLVGRLAVDDSYVYVERLGVIHRLNKDGTGLVVLGDTPIEPISFSVADGMIYAAIAASPGAADGRIVRVSREGGPVETLVGDIRPDGLVAADATGVAYTFRSGALVGIARWTTAGATILLFGGFPGFMDLVSDEQRVVFATSDGAVIDAPTDEEATSFFSIGLVQHLALDGAGTVFLATNGGGIWRFSLR